MSGPTRTIQSISFTPDGISVEYMASTDVRAEGAIYQAHSLSVHWGVEDDELREVMTEIESAADRLLNKAITAWASSRPYDLEAAHQAALDDDDHDEGLGG